MTTSSITMSRARKRGPAESYKVNVFRNQRLYDLARLNGIIADHDTAIDTNFSKSLENIRTTQNSAYALLYKMKDLLSTR